MIYFNIKFHVFSKSYDILLIFHITCDKMKEQFVS